MPAIDRGSDQAVHGRPDDGVRASAPAPKTRAPPQPSCGALPRRRRAPAGRRHARHRPRPARFARRTAARLSTRERMRCSAGWRRMSRTALPDRRRNETVDVEFAGSEFTVTIGYDAAGQAKEVFADGHKEGSDVQATVRDACIWASLLLQHGASPDAIRASTGRVPRWHGPRAALARRTGTRRAGLGARRHRRRDRGRRMSAPHTPATTPAAAPEAVSDRMRSCVNLCGRQRGASHDHPWRRNSVTPALAASEIAAPSTAARPGSPSPHGTSAGPTPRSPADAPPLTA